MKTPPPTPTIDATVPIRNPNKGNKISIIHYHTKPMHIPVKESVLYVYLIKVLHTAAYLEPNNSDA
jgi:hypothetical protein